MKKLQAIIDDQVGKGNIHMRLVQERRIDLDKSITEYLPDSLTRAIHVHKGTDYSNRIKVSTLISPMAV